MVVDPTPAPPRATTTQSRPRVRTARRVLTVLGAWTLTQMMVACPMKAPEPDESQRRDAADVVDAISQPDADLLADGHGGDAGPDASEEFDTSPVDDVAERLDAALSTDANDGADTTPVRVPPAPGVVRACLDDPACDTAFVVAHRGLRAPGVPENSLASLHAAADAGVPMAEIDIRQTADGVLVLMHDPTVQRTTDGRGEIRQMEWAEVEELRLTGADPDNPDAYRVPTLEEALDVAAERSITLYLDIKNADADTIVQAVRSAEAFDLALFRRGRSDLEAIAALAPEAWLLAPVRTLEEALEARAALPTLRMVEIAATQADADLTAALRDAHLHVQQDVFVAGDVLWTLTGDASGWQSYYDAGVRLLQTDRPVELMGWVEVWE